MPMSGGGGKGMDSLEQLPMLAITWRFESGNVPPNASACATVSHVKQGSGVCRSVPESPALFSEKINYLSASGSSERNASFGSARQQDLFSTTTRCDGRI